MTQSMVAQRQQHRIACDHECALLMLATMVCTALHSRTHPEMQAVPYTHAQQLHLNTTQHTSLKLIALASISCKLHTRQSLDSSVVIIQTQNTAHRSKKHRETAHVRTRNNQFGFAQRHARLDARARHTRTKYINDIPRSSADHTGSANGAATN